MAAAERIRELAPQADTESDLARSLIEQVFSGYDVNLTATHMAATTLGLLSPTTQFRNMKIGRTLLGLDKNGKARLGSLEFLGDSQPMLIPFPNAEPTVQQVDTSEEVVNNEPADFIIMNPPFTRDSLRYDQLDPEAEIKVKEREKELFTRLLTNRERTGYSGAFLILADYISKSNGGSIAAILPLVAATDMSGLSVRKYLGKCYHVETIVTSHDPTRIYFSENTNIGEMLAIFRRWPTESGQKPPTKVVNLSKNPSTPAESMPVAWAIANGTVEPQEYGTVQYWPAHRITEGDWGAVQFLSPYLCEEFAALRDGEFFNLSRLGNVAKVGPEGRRIRDAYIRTAMPDVQGRAALWQHDTEKTQTMSANVDTHIKTKSGKEQMADSYWQQRSRLLLPLRLFLQTTRVVSVILEAPAVGSAWTPCRPNATDIDQGQLQKSICVYLNSTIGVLAISGDRTNKKPTYPRLSIDDLRKLVVPDFGVISKDTIDNLASVYDDFCEVVLLPLPQMDADPVRRALDDAVCDALGLDGERVATIRRNLAAEPSVTGKRYAGLRPA